MTEHTFYSTPEYYDDLIERLASAAPGDYFITVNMVTRIHPQVQPLLDAMGAAAKRGVAVTLITDAYQFLTDPDHDFILGPLFFNSHLPARLPKRFQATKAGFDKLEAAGVSVIITNEPGRAFTNPKAGRSHIKFTVTGDRYYIATANLTPFRKLDVIAGANDARIAEWLRTLAARMMSMRSGSKVMSDKDVTFETPSATLFLDAGIRDRSIIYDQALALIDSAKEFVFLTCQFFPYGRTAAHLAAAHRRGVKVTVLYNHDTCHARPSRWIHRALVLRERTRRPKELFAHPVLPPRYLHAKVLATDQGTLIGSHNYVEIGTNLGTAELQLLVRDRDFAEQAMAAVIAQLPPVSQ
jgi:phosphatidylserine/phosphatidylglycerophosphate/cardiolipin synthase-like enzyme